MAVPFLYCDVAVPLDLVLCNLVAVPLYRFRLVTVFVAEPLCYGGRATFQMVLHSGNVMCSIWPCHLVYLLDLTIKTTKKTAYPQRMAVPLCLYAVYDYVKLFFKN
jgi:hypothetical protein